MHKTGDARNPKHDGFKTLKTEDTQESKSLAGIMDISKNSPVMIFC